MHIFIKALHLLCSTGSSTHAVWSVWQDGECQWLHGDALWGWWHPHPQHSLVQKQQADWRGLRYVLLHLHLSTFRWMRVWWQDGGKPIFFLLETTGLGLFAMANINVQRTASYWKKKSVVFHGSKQILTITLKGTSVLAMQAKATSSC